MRELFAYILGGRIMMKVPEHIKATRRENHGRSVGTKANFQIGVRNLLACDWSIDLFDQQDFYTNDYDVTEFCRLDSYNSTFCALVWERGL